MPFEGCLDLLEDLRQLGFLLTTEAFRWAVSEDADDLRDVLEEVRIAGLL